MHKQLAKITRTFLGWDTTHGVFTASLDVDYGVSSQGVGLHQLSYNEHREDTDDYVTHYRGVGEYIAGILRACGVDRWEDLVGRTIHVLFPENDAAYPVGIEHLPTEKGGTFMFSEWQQVMRESESV
jgi:hypothetical protein